MISIIRGIYVLIVSLDTNIHVNVGALGRVDFEKGLYAYVGSAQNGLQGRIKRCLRDTKHRFWHIDYLLENKAARILVVLGKEGDKCEECRIAGLLGERGVAIDGFGSSDCRCRSHFYVAEL